VNAESRLAQRLCLVALDTRGHRYGWVALGSLGYATADQARSRWLMAWAHCPGLRIEIMTVWEALKYPWVTGRRSYMTGLIERRKR